MSAPVYMNWYPSDYLRDTRHLSTEQHGAYRLLLDECWMREGVLPDNDRLLSKLTGLTPAKWSRIKGDVLAFFTWTPNGWRHKRIETELAKAAEAKSRRSQAGRKGGRPKSNALAGLKPGLSNLNVNVNEDPSQEEDTSKVYPFRERGGVGCK